MKHSAKIRFIATAGFALSTLLPAQTPQLTSAPQQPLPASQQSPQRAEVTYNGGKLFVSAANSSLNQILRDIARETGMKITGGATEERVFGKYGPAAPAQILAALLEGTGSNMLLLQATTAAPAELILTPRHGGPTQPNPNASDSQSEEDMPPPPARPPYSPATPPEANAPGNPAATQPTQPKTPQQIYEQLQRIRQQQQQQPQQSNPQ
jgi:hypothetical protein